MGMCASAHFLSQCVGRLESWITALGASHAPSHAGIGVSGMPLEATARLADTSVRAAVEGRRGKVCQGLCDLLERRRTHHAPQPTMGRFYF